MKKSNKENGKDHYLEAQLGLMPRVSGKQLLPEFAQSLLIKCEDCGELVQEESISETRDGKKICEVCRDDNYIICDHCRELVSLEETTRTENDTAYCENCASSHTFYCEHCEQTFDRDSTERHETGYGTVCDNCLDAYSECYCCNTLILSDELNYCEPCDIYYCENCEHSCNNDADFRPVELTHLYGRKPGEFLKIDRLVGVELEAVDGRASYLGDELPASCGIETDGSLSSSGIEVTTPPASMDKAEEIIRKSCNVLSGNGYSVNQSCGLHVHLDASDFRHNPIILSRVLRTVYAIEDILFSMVPPSRWDNQYCLPLSREYSFNRFNGKMSIESFESKWYRTVDTGKIESSKKVKNDGYTRYCGLNLHSTMYRGTVEFRYHSGTLESDKVLKWIALLLNVIDYAVNRFNYKEIVALYAAPTTMMKLKRFFKVFGINNCLKSYIRERIEKFNPRLRAKKRWDQPPS